jgi:hypothetical protein
LLTTSHSSVSTILVVACKKDTHTHKISIYLRHDDYKDSSSTAAEWIDAPEQFFMSVEVCTTYLQGLQGFGSRKLDRHGKQSLTHDVKVLFQALIHSSRL